jgi:hypothetical protein
MQDVVSSKTLIKSSLGATVIAALVFVGIILPAEYNIDPTGLGEKLGLSILSSTTEQTASQEPNQKAPAQAQQVIEVSVPAGKGIEYKFQMNQYDKMTYEWLTDGPSLYFDLHGEPQGDSTGYFESYAIATLSEMKGSFTAPFTGSHGWYWKNTSEQPVVIQLMVEGQFKIIGLKP